MSDPAPLSPNGAASSTARITHDYGWDVGNLHAIDYRLWLAELPIRRPGCEAPRSLRFTDNWTRP